jgi:hypothetical protein
MKVYVVIGVWSGCIQHVTAWSDKDKANEEAERMKKDWGTALRGQHIVDLYELDVR